MAMEEIFDLNADVVTKLEKKGQKISGYYLGFSENKTKFGLNKLHVLRNDKGNEGIWGSAQLDAKLGRVAPGSMTEITFLDKTTLDNGMTLKQFKVTSDRANAIDVSTIAANESGSDEGTEESYSDDSDATDTDVSVAPAIKGSFGKDHAKNVGNLLKKSN